MAIWLKQADLENATSVATVLACFDDGSGTVNTSGVAYVIDRAEQEVLSWLVDELGPAPINATVMAQLAADNFLKYAALEYAVAHMFDRHPEYVRSGDRERGARFTRADERMQRVLDARQRPPTVATAPSNVGGYAVDNGNRLFVDSADGTKNSGDY